ncbi:MAG: pilus assembly protein [Armatimonadetes bacterium]|nr:pilus assembly protein [Armatimonadota bacterium]
MLRRRSGQALIETGVVAGFLVILLLGVTGFGNILQASIRCETAAREGCRRATTDGTNDEVRQGILANLSRTGDPADVPGQVAIGISPMDPAQRTFNTNVTVEVWWSYPVPVPVFNLMWKERMLYARKIMVVTVGS